MANKIINQADLVQDKIDELTGKIKGLTSDVVELNAAKKEKREPVGVNISLNTASTQLYAKKRDRRVLQLIQNLLNYLGDDGKLTEEDRGTLALLTTLESEKTLTKYEFHEGDDIVEILMKYENLNKKSLEEKLAKLGLKADYTTKKIVKA